MYILDFSQFYVFPDLCNITMSEIIFIESSKNNGSRVTSSPGAMQPNTVSPHLTNKNTEMCKPFSLYKDDTVTSGMKEGLYSFLESVGDSFKTIGTESARGILEESTKHSQSRK